jgi:hypothetical protein
VIELEILAGMETDMSSYKQRIVDFLQEEWGTYIERFNRLPINEGAKRVKEEGYESFRDMLAHILAWWEEGFPIVQAIAENREFERRKYDFDIFNAEAVSRYKPWNEAEFLTRFESYRQEMVSGLGSMDEAVFENLRVKSWLDGIIVHHAREHNVALSRFLVMDTLENEWGGYVERFNALRPGKQAEFLSKQGFEKFRDIIAHVIGWWEETLRVITNVLEDPGFVWEEREVDAFNAELVKKFKPWSEGDLYLHFENVRNAALELVAELPDDALRNKDIESWLAADVVGHFDDHAL